MNKKFEVQNLNMDLGGAERAFSIYNEILNGRLNLFNWKKGQWPFKSQTPAELEKYLFCYGNVFILKIENELMFFPVNISINNFSANSQFLNKFNVKNTTFSPIATFNQNIIKAFSEEETKKNEIPLIFDNFLQMIPKQNQKILIEQLKDTYNAEISNKINKNKQFIIPTENGQYINQTILLSYAMRNFSPFYLTDFKTKNPLDLKPANTLSAGVNDLYISYKMEFTDLINELKTRNGLIKSKENNKTSAQETDNQTENNNYEVYFVLKNMLNSRKEGIKRINKIFNLQMKITLNNEYEILTESIKNNLLDGKEEKVEEEPKQEEIKTEEKKEEEPKKRSILNRFKRNKK